MKARETMFSLLAVLCVGCSAEDGGQDFDAAEASLAESATLLTSACGIELTSLTLNQAAEVALYRDGAAVPSAARRAPVVQNRKALLRVFAKPLGPAHAVTARLTLTRAGSTNTFQTTRTLSNPSNPAHLSSTFNFYIDPQLITHDTAYAVKLLEPWPCSGARAITKFPAQGVEPLAAQKTGKVRVKLVPIHTNGGFIPVADANLGNLFAKTADAQFPSESFEVSIAPALTLNIQVTLEGLGWARALDALAAARTAAGAPANTHWFGLLRPTETYTNGVPGVGIAGTGSSATVGLGISYPGSSSFAANNFVHQLGHMHGLRHSLCASVGWDPNYPYLEGKIGTWGWDKRTNTLLNPATTYDFMGECEPVWVSDYVYGKLVSAVARIATAN